MVSSVEPHHFESEGLRPVVGRTPKVMGRSICPSGMACFPGMIPWKGTPVGRMRARSMPIASSVSAYMMLRPLPPSISTLVSYFVLTIGLTTSRYLPGCGTLSRWLVQSKVMANSDHRRKAGVAGSIA